jgi:3-oxoacyl-[acyl-carrier protein] reductase
MNLGIAGRTAIVTAANGGLGSAVASRLAAEGANLVLFSRSQEALVEMAAGLERQHGVRALAVAGDMGVRQDVQRLVTQVQDTFGGPDILVLNTGRPPLPGRDLMDETDDARWEEAYRTQLWGAMLVSQAIAPLLVQRKWGRIVCIGSASVKQPMPRHVLSTVFRAGVTGLMKHLANEVGAHGVTVNTVCPASVETDSLSRSYDLRERLARIPVGRLGRPEELAAAVAFFASDLAGFITGTSLAVDGGMVSALN